MTLLRATRHAFVCIHPAGFYFRICGRGLSFDIDRPKIFSERYGYKKILRVGRISIEVLK